MADRHELMQRDQNSRLGPDAPGERDQFEPEPHVVVQMDDVGLQPVEQTSEMGNCLAGTLAEEKPVDRPAIKQEFVRPPVEIRERRSGLSRPLVRRGKKKGLDTRFSPQRWDQPIRGDLRPAAAEFRMPVGYDQDLQGIRQSKRRGASWRPGKRADTASPLFMPLELL